MRRLLNSYVANRPKSFEKGQGKGILLFYQIFSKTYHFWQLSVIFIHLPNVVDHIIRIVSLNLFIGWLNAVRRQKESCFESLITVTIRVTRGRTWKGKKSLIGFDKIYTYDPKLDYSVGIRL